MREVGILMRDAAAGHVPSGDGRNAEGVASMRDGVRRSALGGRAMNSERGRGGEVVLGAFCIVLAGTALAGATLVHGWISWVVVLLGVALLGVGVGLMTMPVRRCGPRLRR
jgi:hypothetical protein